MTVENFVKLDVSGMMFRLVDANMVGYMTHHYVLIEADKNVVKKEYGRCEVVGFENVSKKIMVLYIKINFPRREIVEIIRRNYPVGCRVELVRMEDIQAPPIGTKGTVVAVDDIGSLIMNWDNGSTLNVIYGEDCARRIDK